MSTSLIPVCSFYYDRDTSDLHSLPLRRAPNMYPVLHHHHCRRARNSNGGILLCRAKRKGSSVWKKRKAGFIDYDKGENNVFLELPGLGRDAIPLRYKLRRPQKDMKLSEVVDKILSIDHRGDIVGILNQWPGRYSRQNFPILIRELSDAGAIEHCNKVFRWMKSQRIYCARNDIYNMMIRLHARHNQADQARGFFFEMQEWRCKPDTETYNALINAHGRVGQWQWAMNIMDDMLRAAGQLAKAESVFAKMQLDSCYPDVMIYTTLMHAHSESGNIERATEIFREMEMDNIKPDSVACSALMRNLNKGSQHVQVLSLGQMMRERNIPINGAAFSEMIKACDMSRDWRKVIDLIDELESLLPVVSHGVHNLLLRILGKCGRVEAMMKLFLKLEALGVKASFRTYSILLDNLLAAGKWRKCVEVLRWMEDSGITPSLEIYQRFRPFILKSYGTQYADMLKERISTFLHPAMRKTNLFA